MPRAVFMAAFHPEDDGGFSVTFPDVPAAITQGETFDNALLNAVDALQTVLGDAIERGLTPPEPSHRDTLIARICSGGAQAVPVPLIM